MRRLVLILLVIVLLGAGVTAGAGIPVPSPEDYPYKAIADAVPCPEGWVILGFADTEETVGPKRAAAFILLDDGSERAERPILVAVSAGEKPLAYVDLDRDGVADSAGEMETVLAPYLDDTPCELAARVTPY